MATPLSVETIDRSGLAPSGAAADAGGNEFANDGKVFLEVDNQDASSTNVTIVTQQTSDGLAVADRVVSVGATSRKLIGPFPASIYNDGSGKVQLTYSSVTSLTVFAYALTTA